MASLNIILSKAGKNRSIFYNQVFNLLWEEFFPRYLLSFLHFLSFIFPCRNILRKARQDLNLNDIFGRHVLELPEAI